MEQKLETQDQDKFTERKKILFSMGIILAVIGGATLFINIAFFGFPLWNTVIPSDETSFLIIFGGLSVIPILIVLLISWFCLWSPVRAAMRIQMVNLPEWQMLRSHPALLWVSALVVATMAMLTYYVKTFCD